MVKKYLYGSHTYGVADIFSDEDFIVIQDRLTIPTRPDDHHFTEEMFQKVLNSGDIACLEVYFNYKLTFNLDLDKESFRRNISMITSNSWVKGKKKLIVTSDYDLRVGLKSVYHSLRILDFAIQIGETGKIYDFTKDSWILQELHKLSKHYERQELWEHIEEKFKKEFNKRKSVFKVLFPIDKQKDKFTELKAILNRYEVFSEPLYIELKSLL